MRIEKTNIESYISEVFAKETPLMQKAKAYSKKLEKDGISISAMEGAIVEFLLDLHHSKKVIELGTLTGYSALWMARSLQKRSGKLWTFEKSETHGKYASEIFQEYNQFEGSIPIHLHLGDAEEKLKTIENESPFDVVFIDANKSAYLRYLDWAKINLRPGGLVIADNVFLEGSVFNQDQKSEKFSRKQIQVMQEFNKKLGSQFDFQAVILPTQEGLAVGIKN